MYDYIGVGSIWIQKRDSAEAARMIGNCSKLSFAISEGEKSLRNYLDCGGGEINSINRIESVSIQITAHDLSPENLAMALYGTASATAGGTVTDESHVITLGQAIELDFPSSAITTVKEGVTVLVANTDYEIIDGDVVPKAGGALIDGDTVLVTYTRVASATIQALVNGGFEYDLEFRGMNEAHGCRTVNVNAFRVKFSPTSGLDLIGDDFGSMELTGKVLRDPTKTGSGVSKYMKVVMATAAA
ncbi:MAG: hypothetical protein M3Q51_06165 [Pseudomonadota bacterium]|nr:hypothetical protein [Pseudomonadota bacterium]